MVCIGVSPGRLPDGHRLLPRAGHRISNIHDIFFKEQPAGSTKKPAEIEMKKDILRLFHRSVCPLKFDFLSAPSCEVFFRLHLLSFLVNYFLWIR
jgi:hypothetical protein